MASRPVFFVQTIPPYYQEESVSFQYNAGFSSSQKRKNIQAISEAFTAKHRNARILEISSKSEDLLGVKLSAFNLRMSVGSIATTVEAAFQGGKVFQNGGPYTDLLSSSSYAAKKDSRLQSSGALVAFSINGTVFPLEPKTFFYDWLYVSALAENNELAEKICQYNAFTDIEFNPQKSINCQARSAAIFVSLAKLGFLKNALLSPTQFKQTVYGDDSAADQQISLFL